VPGFAAAGPGAGVTAEATTAAAGGDGNAAGGGLLPAPSSKPNAAAAHGAKAEVQQEHIPDDSLVSMVLEQATWRKARVKALVQNLIDAKHIKKEELPRRPDEVSAPLLTRLKRRFEEVTEFPLRRYAAHLKPKLFRRVHVGNMDYIGESHESYRRAFDFLETTNTWHDIDRKSRFVSQSMRQMGCGYKDQTMYDELAARAQDGFKVVIKVSHVATHVERLDKFEEWWPTLYREKYSRVAQATVAYLWQFPPSFEYDKFGRLQRLVEYLRSADSGAPEARHIVDFRHASWYREDTYDFLRASRWCLAWLHINNEAGWASHLPSGWTDRVQTTNFCYLRLFGPDGASHGLYDKKFLHSLFDCCPMGATTYVLLGNRETLEDANPIPPPAFLNAVDFRSIFTKMDFVERIRTVRYEGECPRELTTKEQMLVNSFYLRFSQRARVEGVCMATPVANQWAQKYYPQAEWQKRCFEWFFPRTKRRLHMSLHDAMEQDDLWTHMRQLTGFEDLEATKGWVMESAARRAGSGGVEQVHAAPTAAVGGGSGGRRSFLQEERALLNGGFIRWSERARQAGLLITTKLEEIAEDGGLCWRFSNGEEFKLSVNDLLRDQDIWPVFLDLLRMAPEQEKPQAAAAPTAPTDDGMEPAALSSTATPPVGDEEEEEGAWKKNMGEMWKQERPPPGINIKTPKEDPSTSEAWDAGQNQHWDKEKQSWGEDWKRQSWDKGSQPWENDSKDCSWGKENQSWEKDSEETDHKWPKWDKEGNSNDKDRSFDKDENMTWEKEDNQTWDKNQSWEEKQTWDENDQSLSKSWGSWEQDARWTPLGVGGCAADSGAAAGETAGGGEKRARWGGAEKEEEDKQLLLAKRAKLQGDEEARQDALKRSAEPEARENRWQKWLTENPVETEGTGKWIRWGQPGSFFYVNTEDNTYTFDLPPPLQATWDMELTEDGQPLYVNKSTRERTLTPPPVEPELAAAPPPTSAPEALGALNDRLTALHAECGRGGKVNTAEVDTLEKVLRLAHAQLKST